MTRSRRALTASTLLALLPALAFLPPATAQVSVTGGPGTGAAGGAAPGSNAPGANSPAPGVGGGLGAAVPNRPLTLADVVARAVGGNSGLVTARQRLQKAQELIVQVNAQGRPQFRADAADTYTSYPAFAPTLPNPTITNPTLPGGGQIPVVVDQGNGFSTSFIGGGVGRQRARQRVRAHDDEPGRDARRRRACFQPRDGYSRCRGGERRGGRQWGGDSGRECPRQHRRAWWYGQPRCDAADSRGRGSRKRRHSRTRHNGRRERRLDHARRHSRTERDDTNADDTGSARRRHDHSRHPGGTCRRHRRAGCAAPAPTPNNAPPAGGAPGGTGTGATGQGAILPPIVAGYLTDLGPASAGSSEQTASAASATAHAEEDARAKPQDTTTGGGDGRGHDQPGHGERGDGRPGRAQQLRRPRSAPASSLTFSACSPARDAQKDVADFYTLDIERLQNETALAAKNLFFNVLLTQQQVATQEEQVRYAQENVRITEARLRQGIVSRFDVLTAQTALSTAQQQLIAAQDQAGLAQADLSYLIGTDPDQP